MRMVERGMNTIGLASGRNGRIPVRLAQSCDVVNWLVLQFAAAAAVDDAVLEVNHPVVGGRQRI